MSAVQGLGIAWARPLGLLALALPLVVLLASRTLSRPEAIATGTLDLWKRVLLAREPSGGARRRVPPAVWVLALGLVLASLALAGPRSTFGLRPGTLRVLVDRSPSTDLPLGSTTRRERATAMAREWIATSAPEGARVEWVDRRGAFGPEDDRPGTIWVTDHVPDPSPERAGLFASGGPAVPGPIAVDGDDRYDWDGERIVPVAGSAPPVRVAVEGTLPAPVSEVLAAWAAERRARVEAAGAEAASLRIRAAGGEARRSVATGRDGWTANVQVAGDPAQLATWLEDGEHRALVSWEPGRIEVALASMDPPEGDPAAFAVSWGRLFDAAALPPPGVVELAERVAAGDAVSRPPRLADADPATARPSKNQDAWLASGALLCTLLALGLARSRGIE